MTGHLKIGDHATLVDRNGNITDAQLTVQVCVSVFAVGIPGKVQYNVTAEGVVSVSEALQAKILRAAADYVEEQK